MHQARIIFFLFCFFNTARPTIDYLYKKINSDTWQLTFSFNIPANDYIYKDYVAFTADSPDVELLEYQTDVQPINIYDSTFNETKTVYHQSFTATLIVKILNSNMSSGFIHVTYYQHSKKKYQTQLYALPIDTVLTKKDNDQKTFKALSPEFHTRIPPSKNEPLCKSWMRFIIHTFIQWQAPLILCSVISCVAVLFLLPWLYTCVLLITLLLFYFLFLIFPWHFMIWLSAVYALCIGIYLLVIPLKIQHRTWYRTAIGIFLIASSIIGFLKAYSFTYLHKIEQTSKQKALTI